MVGFSTLTTGRRTGGLVISVCLALLVPGRGEARQDGDSVQGAMFPTPFARVVEKRFFVDGELDHRWRVRETYWDHWLILETASAGNEGEVRRDDARREHPEEIAAPLTGRRRMIDLKNGDIVEIDWGAGTFWRSTRARQRDLIRRLELAESTGLVLHSAPASGGEDEPTREHQSHLEIDPGSRFAAPPPPLVRLEADRRLFATSNGSAPRDGHPARASRVDPRQISIRVAADGSRIGTANAPKGVPRVVRGPEIVEASVWFDDRIVLSTAALRALEELADGTDSTDGLITIAADVRASTSGALPLAAEATVRLPGPTGEGRLAKWFESTTRLEVTLDASTLVRVPPQLREVAPPLEAVVRRAETERRLDQGEQP